MTEPRRDTDSINRRNALKALAAATGAISLAALPTRWKTPVAQVGAIPAHAQTSQPPQPPIVIVAMSTCSASPNTWVSGQQETLTVQINQAIAGVSISADLYLNGNLANTYGPYLTDATGTVQVGVIIQAANGWTVELRWRLTSAPLGSGPVSCSGTAVVEA